MSFRGETIFFKTENLSKAFGGVQAVYRVGLEIERGDICALIGPNGAGKSTFFNLVTKYFEPDEGRVFFKGEDITRLPPQEICKRGIARSFQKVNIYPKLTVFQSVQMSLLSQKGKGLKLFRSAKSMFREETYEILNQVGLSDHADRIGDALSHGDKKRLEVAITLGNEPELMLMDEPTAGMAPEETTATMELIGRLAEQRGLTVFFTEHDMSVVFGISKKIIVLHQGSIICQGKPEEIRANEQVQKVYLGEE
jgi:branched-chain amino acid transport system ATP-binding protein